MILDIDGNDISSVNKEEEEFTELISLIASVIGKCVAQELTTLNDVEGLVTDKNLIFKRIDSLSEPDLLSEEDKLTLYMYAGKVLNAVVNLHIKNHPRG